MSTTEQQANAFADLIGARGSHYELAKKCEQIGLFVQADIEDNAISLMKLQGCFNADGSDIVIGTIRGDSDAEIFGG